jgi:pheromone a factor receptor
MPLCFSESRTSILNYGHIGLALFNMFRQRTNISQHLLTRESTLTVPSFVCQLLSTAIQTSLVAFVIIYSIFAQTSLGLRPWTSWSAVHSRFSEIMITSDTTLSEPEDAMVDFTWWTIPVYSLIFIVFFAFDKFSQGHCSSWVRKIMLQKIDPALPMQYVHLIAAICCF